LRVDFAKDRAGWVETLQLVIERNKVQPVIDMDISMQSIFPFLSFVLTVL
jgi:hypothetical protein